MLIIYHGLPPSKNHAKERFGIGYTTSGKSYTRERYKSHVTNFLATFHLEAEYDKKKLEEFVRYYEATKPYDILVSVTYYTDTQRFDRQNYIQFLSDGLQNLLGINDRWFVWRDNSLRYSQDPLTEIKIGLLRNTFLEQKKLNQAAGKSIIKKLDNIGKAIKL